MPAQSLPPRKRGAGIQSFGGKNLDSAFAGMTPRIEVTGDKALLAVFLMILDRSKS